MEGSSLERYKILEKLGGGGMGVVFKAEDVRLKRTVALKFLPEELSLYPTAKQRFIREARAAAALDHPNIAVVHDVGDSPKGMFIAMAFYPGETIKAKLSRGLLSIEEALRLAQQIAEGLAAAHVSGVVHRDIKPANVMVTEEGQAKIVDFGLAKLAGEVTLTRAGSNPGTVGYMSPEQLRGETVDYRTDLWSLGAVLYEMIAGHRPFAGETEVSAINSILNKPPIPLLSSRSDCPELVDNLVLSLLSKNREIRPESASIVAQRLADLLFVSDSTRTMPFLEKFRHDTTGWRGFLHRPGLLKALALSLVAVALLIWVMVTALERFQTAPLPVGRPLQVTDFVGWESDSVISAQGGLIAFAANESGNADIWIVDAKGGNPLQLTDDSADDHQPSWYPDGTALAYTSDRSGESAIWKIPRLGGSSTMLIRNAADPAVSPDGSALAYAQISSSGDMRIAVTDLRSPRDSTTLTDSDDGLWGHRDPSWSPDGKWICYSDGYDLWLVPASGGESKQLTSEAAGDLEPSWSPDGRFVYFTSYRDGTLALWRVRSAGGTRPQRLTVGSGPERHPTVAADGQRLSYDTFLDDTDVVLVDLELKKHVVIPGSRSETGPTLSPDGHALVYVSDRWAGYNLWLQRIDGLSTVGDPIRINDESAASSNPVFSPDGDWIAYQRREGVEREIWIVSAEGGVPNRVTKGPGVETHPAWAPDGTEIAYVSYSEGRSELRRVPVQNGTTAGSPTQIRTTVQSVMHPDWSDDGKSIVYIGIDGPLSNIWRSWTDPEREPIRVAEGVDPYFIRWRPETNTILVSAQWDGESLTIREIDPDSGEVRAFEPVIDFGADAVGGEFDLDSSGRFLAFTREQASGDVWLLAAESGVY